MRENRIQLVAVDMDGTFVNKKHEYDRERFKRVYARMKEQGVHFVVASGNQYYQLRSFFEPFADELTYSSENGGLVVDQGEVLFSANLPKERIDQALEVLKGFPEALLILSCEKCAYMLDTAPEFFVAIMRNYFHKLKLVSSFEEIENDPYLKICVGVQESKTMEYAAILQEKLQGILEVTSSGHGCIDLIGQGLHKASALELLMKRWDLTPDQCMAFGDGYNDLEMLRLCKYGYAMANSPQDMLDEMEYHAPSNEENGVLTVLEEWFL